MKLIGRILSMMLAVVMVLSLATTAFATESGYDVTVKNAAGHIYKIYQIFTGDLSTDEDGSKILANLKYGENYGTAGTEVPNEVLENFDPTTIDITTDIIGDGDLLTTNGETATITVDTAGYYMIVDVTASDALPEGDTLSAVMFQVVADTEITSKHTGTTIEKKVEDINDSTGEKTTDEDGSTWIDSADYDIGDTVPFQSTAHFEGMDNYTTYKVVFTDIMAAGLTYNTDMKVFVNDVDVTENFSISFSEYANAEDRDYDGGTKITVTCDDIKEIAGVGNAADIVLKYTATLNNNAKLGAPGNPNKIKVRPFPDGEGGEETPWDVNIVFTYKAVVNKVDENQQPLSGAVFTLEKFVIAEDGEEQYKEKMGNWVALNTVEPEPDTTFTFNGLDDGYYRLTETETPVGYNTIDPIEFEVVADHVIVSPNPSLRSLSGDVAGGEITFNASEDKSTLSTTVVNNKGAELPETGGVGTTIFYILGGILVLGAVVILVTKRRMNAEV